MRATIFGNFAQIRAAASASSLDSALVCVTPDSVAAARATANFPNPITQNADVNAMMPNPKTLV